MFLSSDKATEALAAGGVVVPPLPLPSFDRRQRKKRTTKPLVLRRGRDARRRQRKSRSELIMEDIPDYRVLCLLSRQ